MGQFIYTKTTFLIEHINASGSVNVPRAICSDFKQAVAWAIVQLSEHLPYTCDIEGTKIDITQWEDNMVAGVYIVPTMPAHLDHLPLQLCVRAIEELAIAETK